MSAATTTPENRQLAAPHAAAIAGVISAVLFIASLTLIMLAFPETGAGAVPKIVGNVKALYLALNLVPFAGIFFLWFLGVTRDRLGSFEDKFFATIFLGSGLLYLAMTFVATAIAFGFVTAYAEDSTILTSPANQLTIAVIDYLTFVYSARMAAVFMISSATLWLRTGVMPRWLAFLSYLVALVLLFVINISRWTMLAFPIWILIVSLTMLAGAFRRQPLEQAA